MTRPPRTPGQLLMAFALLLNAISDPASAQALAQPQTVVRVTDVTQFGLRPDAQFVACDGTDCPARTAKHLAPDPVAVVSPPEVSPAAIRHPAPKHRPPLIRKHRSAHRTAHRTVDRRPSCR